MAASLRREGKEPANKEKITSDNQKSHGRGGGVQAFMSQPLNKKNFYCGFPNLTHISLGQV